LNKFLVRDFFDESTFDPDYDMIEKVAEIDCIWPSFVQIDEKKIWELNKLIPNKLVDFEKKLPSDSVFREDLI